MTIKAQTYGQFSHRVPIKTATTSLSVINGNYGKIKEGAICSVCGLIYRHKRWIKSEVLPFHIREHGKETLCPACAKIKYNKPGGIVSIKWDNIKEDSEELLNLIKNVGERAISINVLDRIIKVKENKNNVEVETTSGVLAQRIGRAVEKTYHGNLCYIWSKNEKLVRVQWQGVT